MIAVVGSGCTGAIAARELAERGQEVTVIDAGLEAPDLGVPELAFREMRRGDPAQNRYVLGSSFEGIPAPGVRGGAQLTPARSHVTASVGEWSPIDSEDFHPVESLAYGGLGCAWGAGCCEFSDAELARAGLPSEPMRSAYQAVADHIGISAGSEDLLPYTLPTVTGAQAPLEPDENAEVLLGGWERSKRRLAAKGIAVGRPAVAILTSPHEGRAPYAYRNMDWYDDLGGSVYRPWMTVDALRESGRVRYEGGVVVTRFEEGPDGVNVAGRRLGDGTEFRSRFDTVVLAAGALSSARIVLRSVGSPGARLPLLCNPYSYVAALLRKRLGRVPRERRCGLVQVTMIHDADGTNSDVAMASVYSYESLGVYRVAGEMPLGTRDARAILQYVLPATVIAGIHQPDSGSEGRWCELRAAGGTETGDALHVAYELDGEERSAVRARARVFSSALRRIGAIPLRHVDPGAGASIHYAGTLPFTEREQPLRLAPDGRLHGTRRVWVADGSGFRYLPAKGLSLSLMANAHRVASALPPA